MTEPLVKFKMPEYFWVEFRGPKGWGQVTDAGTEEGFFYPEQLAEAIKEAQEIAAVYPRWETFRRDLSNYRVVRYADGNMTIAWQGAQP